MPSRKKTIPAALIVGAAVIIIAGCSNIAGAFVTDRNTPVAASTGTATPTASASPAATTQTQPAAQTGTDQYRLVQYPDAGFTDFYAQTAAAKKYIHMEMYELKDTTEEQDLVAAKKRGVDVRVILDSAFHGQQVNQHAYSYLTSNGVSVRWAPTGYIYHIKATTFDGTTTDVSTANLTSQYYATGRDAEVVDTVPAQIKAIDATFSNDWNGGKPQNNTVSAPGLIWSPEAEAAMASQISAAKKSVYFTSEELSDAVIYNALAADAKRGVDCQIVMTDSSSWTEGFQAVTAAGCKVHTFPNSTKALYIHEKIILDDAGQSNASVIIGSQNASKYSLTRNRELSLQLTEAQAPSVIQSIASTFHKDFSNSSEWSN